MHKYTNLFLLFMVSLLLSCKSNCSDYEMDAEITVPVDVSNAGSFDIEEYSSSFRLLPLETKAESLIGDINKIVVTRSGDIFIMDNISASLFLFDSQGQFVRKIGRRGNGPDEYVELSDFYYDEKEQKVYLYDRLKGRMLVYNDAGEILEKTEMAVTGNSFAKVGDSFWLYYCYTKSPDNHYYYLSKLDSGFKTIKEGYFPTKEFLPSSASLCFSSNGAEDFFFSSVSDIIYKLTKDKIVPKIKIDFGSNAFPYHLIPELNVEEIKELTDGNSYFGNLSNVIVSDNLLFFKFSKVAFGKPVPVYFGVSDLKSGSAKVYKSFKSPKFPVDYDTPFCVTSSDELVYVVFHSRFDSRLYGELKEKCPSITENSNPVLLFHKLK